MAEAEYRYERGRQLRRPGFNWTLRNDGLAFGSSWVIRDILQHAQLKGVHIRELRAGPTEIISLRSFPLLAYAFWSIQRTESIEPSLVSRNLRMSLSIREADEAKT